MGSERVLKILSFGCAAVIAAVLAAATVVEKLCGSEFAREHIYTALPLLLLWGVMSFASLAWLLKCRMWRRPATFCLHLSFVLILVGALITHLTGRQGRVHLRMDDEPVSAFTLSDGETMPLPFSVSLRDFRLEYYDGTFAPSDFVSTLTIFDGEEHEGRVSMNNILTFRNWRLYQSGYDADARGTVLSVSHDPCGIAVSYTGYVWLLLSMLAFFFERDSLFRRLLRKQSGRAVLVAAALLWSGVAGAAPRTLARESADAFCDLRVCYNDRICPLHTLAREFTVKIYGRSSYDGLTPEQVLAGWFFFYDDWKREPMIKIKGAGVGRILGIEGRYARLVDFNDVNGYKLGEALRTDGPDRRNAEAANEKFNVISSLCTGSLLKIYPWFDAESGGLVWYSLADRPSEDMPYEQWLFIRRSMDLVAERVAMRDWAGVGELADKIGAYQLKEGGGMLPSEVRFEAENLYNRINADKPLAMGLLTVGIISFLLFALCFDRVRRMQLPLAAALCCVFAYLTLRIGLRWFVSGHVPLSNGFETMQFMAWCGTVLTLAVRRRFAMSLPFGFLVCGFALLVAMMGESSPRITNLMPVLQSPLLSLHVMVIMASYTLLAFTMLNGIAAVVMRLSKRGAEDEIERLHDVSRLILCPAVFLLAAGIFIGAVWANISWGRYWGWDPKEVWALITLMVYSAALHGGSLSRFRNPMFFHIFCIAAFLTVLITYFGVNFILGGMHGYA